MRILSFFVLSVAFYLTICSPAEGLQCYLCKIEEKCTDKYCSEAKLKLFSPSDPATFIGKEVPDFNFIANCPSISESWSTAATNLKRDCIENEVCGHYKYEFVIKQDQYLMQSIHHPLSSSSPSTNFTANATSSSSTPTIEQIEPRNANYSVVIVGNTEYTSSVHLFGCVPRKSVTFSPKFNENYCPLNSFYSTQEFKRSTELNNGTRIYLDNIIVVNNASTCCQCNRSLCNNGPLEGCLVVPDKPAIVLPVPTEFPILKPPFPTQAANGTIQEGPPSSAERNNGQLSFKLFLFSILIMTLANKL